MQHEIVSAHNISRMCAVCGTDNKFGLHARFFELDNGELLGVFDPADHHQGYPGRLHGGIASTILDETIGRALNITDRDAWGVTAELTVRFRQPVPIDSEVRVVARITRDSRKLFEGSGEILLADGSVAVEATGKYIKMPIGSIVDGDFEAEWFEDERDRPTSVEL